MSSNNDNSGNAGIAFLMAGAIIVGVLLYAILVFLALALTVWCWFAWDKPVTIFGQTTTPQEAHRFVYGGLAAAAALPIFTVFVSLLVQFHVPSNYWLHLFLGGYTLGFLGIGLMLAAAEEESKKAEQSQIVALRQIEHTAAPSPKSRNAEEFRFANWSDEEAGQ